MKRNISQRIICALLAILLLCPAVFASEAYGPEVYRANIALGTGTSLSTGVFWSETSDDTRGETYISYIPNTTVVPVVDFGKSIVSTTTIQEVSERLSAKGMSMAGGVNGDYFVMATGESLGMLVTDGVLRSSSTYLPALGFKADGSAVIGNPSTKINITIGANLFTVEEVNKSHTGSSSVLYTPDFGSVTGRTTAGVDIIIDTLSGNLTVGGTVTGVVRQVLQSSGAIEIPQGSYVISLPAGSVVPQVGEMAAVQVTTADIVWSQVVTALGGMYILVENGQAVKGLETSTSPRTVVGIKADGTVLFYNSPSTTQGAATTLDQVAVRLVELGCVSAICLDGGGSSTVAVTYPGSQTHSIVNTPSGGKLRSCSNYLVLANTAVSTGVASSLWLYPYSAAVLSGASVSFTTKAADNAYKAATMPGSVTYSVAGRGSITSEGVYTAGGAGTDTVTVSAFGTASGTATVKVVSAPDSIAIEKSNGAEITKLSIEPGESVDLNAVAYSNHVDLISQDTCFNWQVTGSVGTVTQEGVFTALGAGKGTLTVTAGGTSATIDISVQSNPRSLADFENSVLGGYSTGVTATVETTRELVAYGEGSMKFSYVLNEEGVAGIFGTGIQKPQDRNYIIFSVYGDGSGNSLAAVVNGEATNAAVLDFVGWKTVSIGIGKDAGTFDGFIISGETPSGTIYIDQVTVSNVANPDKTPPVITAELEGNVITASVLDDTTVENTVTVSYDGALQYVQPTDGSFAYTAPEAVGSHRVTITAVDAYGNRGEYSLVLGDSTEDEDPFVDMADHWSKDSVKYLYKMGIVNGIPSGDKMYYNPDSNMTRAQFAVIVANWLGVDTEFYSYVELPFDDAASIPDWALNSVKAMYAMGIIKGTANGSNLTFNQGGSITRAEAFTIIGRTQPKGYAKSTLAFDDAGSIPSWAAEHMDALVSRGVVSGYNGKLEPTNNVTRGQVAKILCSLI